LGTSLGVIHDIHDLAYGGGLIPPLVDPPGRMRILGSKYSLALWAEVGVPGWEFAGSSGVVALGTTVSGVKRAKKEKNEPRQTSWFVVGTYFAGLPLPKSPLDFLRSTLLVLPAQILHPAKTSRPHPSGKGRGDVAGIVRRGRRSVCD
jgi:hypothetical protein